MVTTPLRNQNQSAAPTSERQQVIDWLRNNNFPALPVAPATDPYKYHKVVKAQPERGVWEHCPLTDDFKPIPLYTGKNPSYLDRGGKPNLVNHRQYQNRLPSKHELKDWFANPANGVGTLGGWNDTVWLDFDVKQFSSQEECTESVQSILSRPELQGTFIERTHSGGWRIGVRVKSKPGFTNFALSPGGEHVGEALGAGRFTVLAPTVGPSGNAYQSINRAMPVEVESLEAIGIHCTKTDRQERQVERPIPAPTPSLVPGSIPLSMLLTERAASVLCGDNPTGDRSEALTILIREAYGWENWAEKNDVSVRDNTEALAHAAGTALGIDSDRIGRILKTIDPARSHPAAEYKGDESSCWQKILRLDKATYEAKCPSFIKDVIASGKHQFRLHPESIEEVRRRASIVDVVGEHVALTQRGKDFVGACPFHDEKNPSFSVSPTKQTYYCFGCHQSGGAIKFLMQLGKYPFSDVVLDLARRYRVIARSVDGTPITLPTTPLTFQKSDSGSGEGGHDRHQGNEWNAPISWNGEIGWMVTEERIKMGIDPDTGEIRPVLDDDGKPIKEKVNKFVPKCNFDFQVERELCSEDGGGLVIQVKRSVDGVLNQRRVIIKSTDYTEVTRFVDALKTVLGSGIVCNLKKEHLGALIHVRLKEYRERGGRIYQLAERVGQQSDGTWVFEGIQFTRDGNLTTEEESGWVFNPNLGGEDKMPSPLIAPPDPTVLKRLVDAMLKFHGVTGILPAMMALGYVAAGVHYQEIMNREGHFPLINLYGDAGSNKSVASQNGLSLVGWATKGVLHRVSVSGVYEWLKLSGSMTSCLDDPERSRDLDELLKGLYDGRARKVRGNYQEPHSPLMVTSNHACGDAQPATLSRLAQIPFYRQSDGDTTTWDEMQEAQRLASGALPDIIKLGYPAKEIRLLASELRSHLPNAHARVADSLGLVTWYAMAVARLANFSADSIKAYVIEHLCKVANDADSKADSLTDFIDKLQALHSESLIGDWSIRVVDTEDIGKAIAVNMSAVWTLVDERFAPTYSRRVLENLIDKAGGKVQSVQKFHRSKDESLAYRRGLLNPRTDIDGCPVPPRELEMVTRRCILIPASLAQDFIDSWRRQNPPSPDDDGSGGDGGNSPLPNPPIGGGDSSIYPESTPLVTPVTSSYTQLHQKCNQQKPDIESVTAIANSPVTIFEEEMGGSEIELTSVGGVGQDAPTPASDEPEQLDHTLTFEKNVTEADLEPESHTETGRKRLHFGCNSDVTDVTGCNQEEEWDIWEGTNVDTGEPVPAPIDETECVRTPQPTQHPQQPANPTVAPERNDTEAPTANAPPWKKFGKLGQPLNPTDPLLGTEHTDGGSPFPDFICPQPTSRPQPAPALAEAEVDAHAHTQPQQPVTAAAESTVPPPSVLAAQILQCQSWEAAVEMMDIVAAAIDKDRVVVYNSVLKHLSIDDRQHLVRLLAAHIQQFPRDQWAYNWLPESSRKLKEKAQALAQGIKAGEESANE